jgi:hypothetical protein
LKNERKKLRWYEENFHDATEIFCYQLAPIGFIVTREIVLNLLSFVLDLATRQQTITRVFRRFFLNRFVAFHVVDTTNSLCYVSDHEELSAAANSDGFVCQALRSAVVFHVFLEELQRFLSLQVAVASRSWQSSNNFRVNRGTSNLFGS